jgi:hypothetical protein
MLENDGALLRLELNMDSMRLNIMQALARRDLDLQAIVNAEVDRMKHELPAIIRDAIRKNTIVSIERAVSDTCYQMTRQIQPAVREVVRDILGKAFPEEEFRG